MTSWTPHAYQERAIEFMVERGAAGLFLDPGLGKTSITLAAFKVLRNAGMVKRMLVVAPLRVAHHVWPEEATKWDQFSEFKVTVLHGKDKNKLARSPDTDIFVINPEGFASGGKNWYFDYAHKYVQPDMLVIDESTRFKNPSSARFKALKKHLHSFRRRYILTGTPAPKGLEDLWSQMYILDMGGSLGKYITHFRRTHFTPDHMGYGWDLKEGHAEQIHNDVAKLCLRMEARDYLDLPELVETTLRTELPANLRERYLELEREFVTNLGDAELTADTAAVISMKLRQFCNGNVYDEGGEVIHVHKLKLEMLQELVEEAGSPILCAYQFKHDIAAIREYFGYDVPYIGSGVSPAKSASLMESFNRGEIPLLLAHPASAGHGLNLQEACYHVVFYALPWSLEDYTQFIQRVLRQGNSSARVLLHQLLIKGSVEEAMVGVLKYRAEDQGSMLQAVKNHYQL